ncbi:MAG TPA: 2-hydroxyacyl-CoA dehydratase [Geobacteraceae bacterium]
MQRVGFTTTIPLEVLVAAGKKPVDLNNVFIGEGNAARLVEEAETEGFPRNTCGWIKGIFSAVMESGIREMVAVTEGDCSYTKALMELLTLEGVTVIPFAYPHGRDRETLRFEIEKLMRHFGVEWDAVYEAKARLDRIRRKVREIDRLTWEEDRVTGRENHYFQVATSDMNGDPDAFEAEVDAFLREARTRPPFPGQVRLAYLGVPPIFDDLYPFLEAHGGRVVFNETQRQFAMPYELDDLVEQYLAYTYPYDIFHRLADVIPETGKRRVDAVIHYVQSFCFRQIEDLIVRKKLPFPILTLEGDKPTALDARTKIRIEGFLEMLSETR